eukprot:20558-Heterococcus_DN1.PRE.5
MQRYRRTCVSTAVRAATVNLLKDALMHTSTAYIAFDQRFDQRLGHFLMRVAVFCCCTLVCGMTAALVQETHTLKSHHAVLVVVALRFCRSYLAQPSAMAARTLKQLHITSQPRYLQLQHVAFLGQAKPILTTRAEGALSGSLCCMCTQSSLYLAEL